MGFQVYNSQGQELQNLTGSAGGDLTGTYPNPTLAKGPTYVTSLPSSPIDGQEIYYAANTTSGIVWHLRYRSSAATNRWEFIGGSPMQHWVSGSQSVTCTNGLQNYNLPTPATLTPPVSGFYVVRSEARLTTMTQSSATLLYVNLIHGGTTLISSQLSSSAVNQFGTYYAGHSVDGTTINASLTGGTAVTQGVGSFAAGNTITSNFSAVYLWPISLAG